MCPLRRDALASGAGFAIRDWRDLNGSVRWHHATRDDVWVWLMNGTTKLPEHYVGTVPDLGYQVVRPRERG